MDVEKKTELGLGKIGRFYEDVNQIIHGISWDNSRDVMGYCGISWDIMGYHGISWVSERKMACFCGFQWDPTS